MFRKDISYPHACLSNMEKDIFQLVAQPDDLSHIWISIACLPSLTFFRGNYIRSVQLKMRLNCQKVESPSEMSNGLRLLIKQENQAKKHITSAMDWTRFKICVLCPEVLIKHQLADILPNF